VKIPIIGGNGIHTWKDAIELMMWGANLVTACTVIMWKGVRVISSIIKGMESFLEKQGYSSYEEVIGEALPYLMAGSEIYVTPSIAMIDPEKCVSCGKCFELGHCDAVREEEGRYLVKAEECIGCGICAVVCPKDAITLYPKG
jgi:dihydropyrimidine dehydrogenase (NAD+) subunit PreA